MQRLIARADVWLRGNRPDYYATLRPGVGDAELDGYERQFGLKLPKTLRSLWKWKDGGDDDLDVETALVHNHAFISLSESAATKVALDAMIGADFDGPDWWKREWVPFTSSWGGDHYCVDTTAKFFRRPGPVVDFWHDDAERNLLATSFEDWFRWLVKTMEAGELELA